MDFDAPIIRIIKALDFSSGSFAWVSHAQAAWAAPSRDGIKSAKLQDITAKALRTLSLIVKFFLSAISGNLG